MRNFKPSVYLILCFFIYVSAFRKTYIDIDDRLADCPNIIIDVTPRMRNSLTVCGSLCQNEQQCSAFGLTATGCVLYTFTVAAPQPGPTLGSTAIYVKVASNPLRDVLRHILPPANTPLWPGSIGANHLTIGYGCSKNVLMSFIPEKSPQDLTFDLGQQFTIEEIVLTVPSMGNDLSQMTIHIGNAGSRSDPVFFDDFSLPNGLAMVFRKSGLGTGQYITIADDDPNFVYAITSLEAYGYLT